MLPLLREAPARSHRQLIERGWLADEELGPRLPLPPDLRPRVPCVQDGSQRVNARHGNRAGVVRDQSQYRLPGIHQDEPQQLHGHETVEEGDREPVRLAMLGPDGPTGTFSNSAGPLPMVIRKNGVLRSGVDSRLGCGPSAMVRRVTPINP